MLHQTSSGLIEGGWLRASRSRLHRLRSDRSSLHIGSLVPIFGLIHLQRAGGIPVIVVGGGTAMIGDPSGRSAERLLLRPAHRRREHRRHAESADALSSISKARTAPNLSTTTSWLSSLLAAPVPEGHRQAPDRELHAGQGFGPEPPRGSGRSSKAGAGLSYTEFSYMLLQAADFLLRLCLCCCTRTSCAPCAVETVQQSRDRTA